jgi:hypothetical protein
MLKWAVSFTVNRVFILAVIVLAINAYSSSACQIGAHLNDWLSSVTGLDKIARALK